MTELKIKHPKGELTLTEKDIIMDNGACFQLMTQSYFEGWYDRIYTLSKTTCKKLIKDKKLILANQDDRKNLNYYKLA